MAAENTETEIFIDWLEFLKNTYGIANGAVAKVLRMPAQKIANIKRGGSSVTYHELRSMVLAYPVLRTKAYSAGINPDPTPEEFQGMPEVLRDQHRSTIERENELLNELLQLERERNAANEKRIDELLELLKMERRK